MKNQQEFYSDEEIDLNDFDDNDDILFNKKKIKLNTFRRTLIYCACGLQLSAGITIIAINSISSEVYESTAFTYRNKLLLLFVIISIFNWIISWSIGYSDYENKEKKLVYFYAKNERILGKTFHLITLSMFFAVLFSFVIRIIE